MPSRSKPSMKLSLAALIEMNIVLALLIVLASLIKKADAACPTAVGIMSSSGKEGVFFVAGQAADGEVFFGQSNYFGTPTLEQFSLPAYATHGLTVGFSGDHPRECDVYDEVFEECEEEGSPDVTECVGTLSKPGFAPFEITLVAAASAAWQPYQLKGSAVWEPAVTTSQKYSGDSRFFCPDSVTFKVTSNPGFVIPRGIGRTPKGDEEFYGVIHLGGGELRYATRTTEEVPSSTKRHYKGMFYNSEEAKTDALGLTTLSTDDTRACKGFYRTRGGAHVLLTLMTQEGIAAGLPEQNFGK